MGALHILLLFAGVFVSVVALNKVKDDDLVQRLAAIEATLERVLKRVAVLETENKDLILTVDELRRREYENNISIGHDKEEKTIVQEKPRKEKHLNGNKIRVNTITHDTPKRQVTSRSIAFTAVVGVPSLKNLVDGQTIIYHKILSNYGGGYDNTTGVFTAPISGVYIFNFAEMIDPGHNEYLNLVKNGQHIILNYGHGIGSNHLVSSSRTVAVELEVGDEVWVRTAPWSTHGSGQIHGYEFTTFSGWIVAPVNE